MAKAKTERNAELLALYARGWSMPKLAEHFGIALSTVGEIIQRHRIAQGPVDKAEHINQAVDILDELIAAAVEVAHADPAPVTAGKDGLPVVDPERKGPHGEPVFVRDHGGRLAGMQTARSLLERKAKLLGLDSATKTEVSGSVTYQIEGLDPSSLT